MSNTDVMIAPLFCTADTARPINALEPIVKLEFVPAWTQLNPSAEDHPVKVDPWRVSLNHAGAEYVSPLYALVLPPADVRT